MLLVKFVDDTLQGLWRRVEVVRVQLHGKASAAVIAHSHVPAAADAQVGTLGNDVNEVVVVLFQALKYLGGSVSRMVVHHDDVIGKSCLLGKCALDGVANGLLTIVDGYDDRCFEGKILLSKVDVQISRRIDKGIQRVQMGCAGTFHLYLNFAIAGVHVVKLAFTALAQVQLPEGVEVFVQVEDGIATRKVEPQGIPPCKVVVLARRGLSFTFAKPGLEQRSTQQN